MTPVTLTQGHARVSMMIICYCVTMFCICDHCIRFCWFERYAYVITKYKILQVLKNFMQHLTEVTRSTSGQVLEVYVLLDWINIV